EQMPGQSAPSRIARFGARRGAAALPRVCVDPRNARNPVSAVARNLRRPPVVSSGIGGSMRALTVSFVLAASTLFAVPVLAAAPQATAAPAAAKNQTAIFAGGCFWCMEEAFDETKGVVHAISGYTGGRVSD